MDYKVELGLFGIAFWVVLEGWACVGYINLMWANLVPLIINKKMRMFKFEKSLKFGKETNYTFDLSTL